MWQHIRMEIVLADISALRQIREARCGGKMISPLPLPPSDEMATGARQLDRLKAGDLATRESPARILVPSGTSHTRSQRVVQSEWSLPTDENAVAQPDMVFRVRPNVVALTPPACALSLARSWPVEWLALLLDELCGCYSLTPDGNAFIETTPACNLDSIRKFARKMCGQHGIKRLSTAIKLAGNGAASPFESQVHAWLCQNVRRGGFGIPQPLLNATIYIGSGYGGGTAGTQCRPDLYWPDARFGVECDGAQHNDPLQSEQDALRSVRLSNVGIHEARISVKAFHSLNAACDFGMSVRTELGLLNPVNTSGNPHQSHFELWKSLVQSPWDRVHLRRP